MADSSNFTLLDSIKALQFVQTNAQAFGGIYGAAHAFDVPFLFGNFGPSLFSNVAFSNANRPGRLELSAAMMQSLASFARSGDPNNTALGVSWPAWPAKLVLDATPTTKAIRVE